MLRLDANRFNRSKNELNCNDIRALRHLENSGYNILIPTDKRCILHIKYEYTPFFNKYLIENNMTIAHKYLLIALIIILSACQQNQNEKQNIDIQKTEHKQLRLDEIEAAKLIQLPFGCIQQEYPYKAGLTISKESDLALPRTHHPAFYGCFDWHSSVHGHWSVVYLLSQFPDLQKADRLKAMLAENLSAANIQKELDYFALNDYTKSFERTYGWAWLLKLSEELHKWQDPLASDLYQNLKPLSDYISQAYIDYLPKLVYPIRVGEHSNTAFGLSFAYDYATYFKDQALLSIIKKKAIAYYQNDKNCPISWEPSGYDFLSPSLQEIDIMRKVMSPADFKQWITAFIPGLFDKTLRLEPGIVKDRTDGKLVHLSGLNFSRAWCIYPIIKHFPDQTDYLTTIADDHINASRADIFGDHYSGGHWLGSFILYALKSKAES